MMHKKGNKDKKEKQYEELLLEVRRVTRVTRGGRRLAFRAVVVIGDKKGKIGLGISKSKDVTGALKKAIHEAYKNIFKVPIVNANTVPYPITYKYKSAIVKLIPALAGTGLKAGSSVRSVLDLAGYNNILSKIVGTNNKLNNAIATINALRYYKETKQTLTKQGVDKEEKDKIVKGEDSKTLKDEGSKKEDKAKTNAKPSKIEKKPAKNKSVSKSNPSNKKNTKTTKNVSKAELTKKATATKKTASKASSKKTGTTKKATSKSTAKKSSTKKEDK